MIIAVLAITMGVQTGYAAKKTSFLSRTLTQSLPAKSGNTLYVETTMANIKIYGTEENLVQAEAVIEVRNQDSTVLREYLQQCNLELEPAVQGLRLKLSHPKRSEPKKGSGIVSYFKWLMDDSDEISISTQLVIKVPAKQSIWLENQFGDVHLEQIFGQLDLQINSGECQIVQCGGHLTAVNSFAPVSVSRFTGAVDVENQNGEVTLRDIGGSVQVGSSFDKIHFSAIEGNVTISAQNCEIEGFDVRGDADITTSFDKVTVNRITGQLILNAPNCPVSIQNIGKKTEVHSSFDDIDVRQVKESLIIRAESAPIKVMNVTGSVDIESSFDSLEINEVGGELRVEAPSASVRASNIGGAVRISNSFSPVQLCGTRGSILVRGANSKIEVSNIESLPPGSEVRLDTRFEPILLTLPDLADVIVSIKVAFGEMESAFPLYTEQQARAEELKRPTAVKVYAETANGNISILKE